MIILTEQMVDRIYLDSHTRLLFTILLQSSSTFRMCHTYEARVWNISRTNDVLKK